MFKLVQWFPWWLEGTFNSPFWMWSKNNSYCRLMSLLNRYKPQEAFEIYIYKAGTFLLLYILILLNSHNNAKRQVILLEPGFVLGQATPDPLLWAPYLTFPRSHQNMNMNINCNWRNKTFLLCCMPLFPLGSWLLIGWGWGESFYETGNVSGHSLPKARSGAAAEGTLWRPQETSPSMLCLWLSLHSGITPSSLHQIIKDPNSDMIWESVCESQLPHSEMTAEEGGWLVWKCAEVAFPGRASLGPNALPHGIKGTGGT